MNLRPAKIINSEFPVLEVKNFLSKKQSTKIIEELSSNKEFDVHDIHNRRMLVKGSRHFNEFIRKSSISSKLFKIMNSKSFFSRVIKLFKMNFNHNFFKVENNLTSFSKNLFTKHLQKKLTKSKSKDKVYFDIDFSIAGKNYYRGPHRDKPNRFFVFLIYLNKVKKNSGGCLEILKPKKKSFKKKRLINKDFYKKIITPSAGKMVIFLANENSYHAASRFKSNKDKRYFIYGSYSMNKNVNWRLNK